MGLGDTMHGASCYYKLKQVVDGDWLRCTCVNKIPQGPIDRENVRNLKGQNSVADKFQEYKQNLRVNIKQVLSQGYTKDELVERLVAIVICTKDPRNS